MNHPTDRIEYIDFAAGVMIVWLLCYHALWPMFETRVLQVIPWFFFFMPWFFYKSGYFFSPKPLRTAIKKDARKLLRQYVIWSIIGYICYFLQLYFYDHLTFRTLLYRSLKSLFLIGAVPINLSLWFLPILFVVHFLVTVLCRKFDLIWIGLTCLLLSIAIHYIPYVNTIRPIYATAWGLFFFCGGAYLRKYEQNKWVIGVATIVLLIAYIFTKTPITYDCSHEIAWYEYVYWYPASIAGCVVLNNICRWFTKLPSFLFKWVGRHAMLFFVMQGIIYVVVHDWLYHIHPEWYATWQGLVLVGIAYVVLIVPTCLIVDRIKNVKKS